MFDYFPSRLAYSTLILSTVSADSPNLSISDGGNINSERKSSRRESLPLNLMTKSDNEVRDQGRSLSSEEPKDDAEQVARAFDDESRTSVVKNAMKDSSQTEDDKDRLSISVYGDDDVKERGESMEVDI